MIEAIIFDMDGVLLDSEPFWQEAEMEVFGTVGIHLTRDVCKENAGVPVDEIIAHRFAQSPWYGKSPAQVKGEILFGVERRILDQGVLLNGVMETLQFFRRKNIPLALASSSPRHLIDTVLEKFNLKGVFSIIHSAEQEKYGKPHPAVFLTTARLLHVDPTKCLVIEDSFNGLLAAKAARMKVVVLPMTEQKDEPRFDVADLKLRSLTQLNEEQWNRLEALT